jgi:hypothetical protein
MCRTAKSLDRDLASRNDRSTAIFSRTSIRVARDGAVMNSKRCLAPAGYYVLAVYGEAIGTMDQDRGSDDKSPPQVPTMPQSISFNRATAIVFLTPRFSYK